MLLIALANSADEIVEQAALVLRFPNDELRRVRNIRPSFRWGLWGGLAYSALDTYVLRGAAPWSPSCSVSHQPFTA